LVAEMSSEETVAGNKTNCDEVLLSAELGLSRHGVMAAAILSGFSTFIPGILINFGVSIQLGVKLFLILYTISLPAVITALYELYGFTKRVLSLCNAPRIDPVSFIIGVFPLGFIASLYYVESLLASYCEKLRGKIRMSMVDLFINVIVLGLHVIIFARIFNYIIDNIVPQLCSE